MTDRRRPRARVAVIDDDVVLTDLLRSLLVEEGFEVVICSTWHGAHACVIAAQPDVVLLDLRLDGSDAESGWRVLDHLTLDPSTRHIPVILCSGAHEALQAHAPALIQEHGTFVITKPFDLETLLSTLHDALAAHPPIIRLQPDVGCQDVVGHGQRNPLTAREQEVAQLIARGLTNRGIADALVVTPGTVANHIAHILDKLGCSSRVQIATWLLTSRSSDWADYDTDRLDRLPA
jgi:DNA-binding NarL/FixJ family response regulator